MKAVKHISPRELQAMLHNGEEMALLDVREAGQFGESHLLFATPLPYSRLELDVSALIPRKSVRIVLCDDGASGVAETAARRLIDLGYRDIALLGGGTTAWSAAGYTLFAGVNVPSKLFGELVEHAYHTPRITAQELLRMRASGENFMLLDGRPLEEHHKMTIPGSTCCPNAELPYRIGTLVRDPKTKIVVNCAGRTRSILGAQTLINFGVPNPVYALENGTQGWRLADLDLEYGSDRAYPRSIDPDTLAGQQTAARALMTRFAVSTIAAREVEAWFEDESRTTYVCDVRTPEEYKAGSIPGALHAPGGQLIQATDQWVAVRNARIVLADGGEHVRAPVVASWLKQLGCEVHVLENGVQSTLAVPQPAMPRLPQLDPVSTAHIKQALDGKSCTLIDLRSSMNFRKSHIKGSRWSIRPRISKTVQNAGQDIVLMADDDNVARLAALDLHEHGVKDVRLFSGGLDAWEAAGYPVERSDREPPDADCIDYLFFVHDRHAGNREAMKQYLAWETGLIAQLSAEDRALFKVGTMQ